MIGVEVIGCARGLAGLSGAWIDLLERCPEATPFQRARSTCFVGGKGTSTA